VRTEAVILLDYYKTAVYHNKKRGDSRMSRTRWIVLGIIVAAAIIIAQILKKAAAQPSNQKPPPPPPPPPDRRIKEDEILKGMYKQGQ